MEGISESISKLVWTSGKGSSDKTKQFSSVLPEGICRRFSLGEIKKATNDFADDLVVGEVGFGEVYKGFIDDRGISVAIERLNTNSLLGVGELTNGVLLLCQLRHPNVIPLIGYIIDEGEGCLVYEFMVNGNLRQPICGTDHDPLPWKQRLAICIGVARGLHYLHTGLKHTIIHRDVKTRNILLDEKLEAKLKDFGLSKIGPSSLSNALIRIESEVKGSFGYLDPEYFRSSINPSLERERVDLISWAIKCKQNGTMNEIIDPYLMGKIAPECFKIYVDIASSCVRDEEKDRPTIGEVEVGLEHALQLQESADAARKDGEYDYPIDGLTCNDSPGESSPIEMNRYGRSASPSTVENFLRDSDGTELSKDE